jgi:hypothetical protein
VGSEATFVVGMTVTPDGDGADGAAVASGVAGVTGAGAGVGAAGGGGLETAVIVDANAVRAAVKGPDEAAGAAATGAGGPSLGEAAAAVVADAPDTVFERAVLEPLPLVSAKSTSPNASRPSAADPTATAQTGIRRFTA